MNGTTTVGSLAALALALATDAASRGILGESTRAAYLNLREKIRQCVVDDELLAEQTDFSPTLRTRISSAVEQSIEQRAKVKALAIALVEAMRADALQGSLGVSLRRLNVIETHLQEIG